MGCGSGTGMKYGVWLWDRYEVWGVGQGLATFISGLVAIMARAPTH